MNARTLIAVLAVAAAIAAVGGALAYWHAAAPPAPTAPAPTTTGSTAPTTIAYAVALTDPPVVPSGTSAVLVSYSGVAVHAEGYGWIYANASGSVDLLALQNLSVVLAQVSVPANATVNEVRLYVTNASIVVNGTEYPLMLPSGVLKIPIVNASRAARGALVDLQPHVTVAYVGDQPVFIMAPAAVAVPLNYTAPPGTVHHIPRELREEFRHFAANVAVTSAVIRVVGNETIISVTVKNDGSEPVQVLGVGVDGNWSLSVPPITIRTEDLSATIRVFGATAKMHIVFFANGTQLVPALRLAAPYVTVRSPLPPDAMVMGYGTTYSGNETEFDHIMKDLLGNTSHSGPGPVSVAGPNGTTIVNGVSDEHFAPVLGMPGYTLEPGQSATFTFEGAITLGPRLDIGGSNWPVTITVTPIAGQPYGITVMTIPASNATATVTAG
jgi:hypothetical protein